MPDPTNTPNTRHTVFISYSHTDRRYVDELLLQLAPLEREGKVKKWVDTMLKAGDDWRKEIEHAITSARVAILLVSAAFRASRFIAENELPPLLAAAKNEGVLILPIYLGACNFTRSELAGVQAVNDLSKPLNSLPKYRREAVWADVARRVEDALAARTAHAVHPPAPEPREDVDSLKKRSRTLAEQGKFDEALAAFERMLALDPKLAAAWVGKGSMLVHLDRFEEALVTYDMALALDPEDASEWVAKTWTAKAAVLNVLNRGEEALAAYNHALALDDKYANTWTGKARTLRALGRTAEADEAEQRARDLGWRDDGAPFPASMQPALDIAPTRIATAITAIEAAYSPAPVPPLTESVDDLIARAAELGAQGKHEEALGVCQQALTLDASSQVAWALKEGSLRALGRPDEAQNARLQALAIEMRGKK